MEPLFEPRTLALGRCLGTTTSQNSCFSVDWQSGSVVFAAGCVAVKYDPKLNRQVFFKKEMAKPIASLRLSLDGRWLAVGERGHNPEVLVWSVETHELVSVLAGGHQHGISCLAFSPDGTMLVSIGFENDRMMNAWRWKKGRKLGSARLADKVHAVSFGESGDYFVTAGKGHVKFWTIKMEADKAVPIEGRAAILGDQRTSRFVDVACGSGPAQGYTFCVTATGLLVRFNSGRCLDKWADLKVSHATSVAVNDEHVICGCADGIIRIYSSLTMYCLVTLPLPSPMGSEYSGGMFLNADDVTAPIVDPMYPRVLAVGFDMNTEFISCIYGDRTFRVWQVVGPSEIRQHFCLPFHSAGVFDIACVDMDTLATPSLEHTIVTCSADKSMRWWRVYEGYSPESVELDRIVYVEPSFDWMKKAEFAEIERVRQNGLRCIKTSHDGKHLACGDSTGNVRIYETDFFEQIILIEVHQSEVRSIDYSNPLSGACLFASAGDRLIHVFDANNNYSLVHTLEEHLAAISCILFVYNLGNEMLRLLSCSADRALVFRQVLHQEEHYEFVITDQVRGKHSLSDMGLDFAQKYVATVGHDRFLRIYDIGTGSALHSYQTTAHDSGSVNKIAIDASGMFVATSTADKRIRIHNFYTGECIAIGSGHGEGITALRFLGQRQLVSASSDGCIFVWQLPQEVSKSMVERLEEIDVSLITPTLSPEPGSRGANHPRGEEPHAGTSSFASINWNALPAWARKQVAAEQAVEKSFVVAQDFLPPAPKGKWALKSSGISLFTEGDTPVVAKRTGRPVRFSIENSEIVAFTPITASKISASQLTPPPSPPPVPSSVIHTIQPKISSDADMVLNTAQDDLDATFVRTSSKEKADLPPSISESTAEELRIISENVILETKPESLAQSTIVDSKSPAAGIALTNSAQADPKFVSSDFSKLPLASPPSQDTVPTDTGASYQALSGLPSVDAVSSPSTDVFLEAEQGELDGAITLVPAQEADGDLDASVDFDRSETDSLAETVPELIESNRESISTHFLSSPEKQDHVTVQVHQQKFFHFTKSDVPEQLHRRRLEVVDEIMKTRQRLEAMGFMVTRSGRTTPHCDERLKTLEQMSVSLPEFRRTPDMTPRASGLPHISVDDTVLYKGSPIHGENASASPGDDIGEVGEVGGVGGVGEDSSAPQCSTPIRPSTASTPTQMDMSCIPSNPANLVEPPNPASSSPLDPTVTSASVKVAQFASTHSAPLLDETVVIQSRANIVSKEEGKLERVDSLSSVVSLSDAPSSPRGDPGRKGSRHLPQPPQTTPAANPSQPRPIPPRLTSETVVRSPSGVPIERKWASRHVKARMYLEVVEHLHEAFGTAWDLFQTLQDEETQLAPEDVLGMASLRNLFTAIHSQVENGLPKSH